MQKLNKKALIISLAIALISAIILFKYMQSLNKHVAEKPKIRSSLRSKFKPGDEILDRIFLKKKWNPGFCHALGITDRNRLLGKL